MPSLVDAPSRRRLVALALSAVLAAAACQGQAPAPTGSATPAVPSGSGSTTSTDAAPSTAPDVTCADGLGDAAAVARDLEGTADGAAFATALACLGARVLPDAVDAAAIGATLDGTAPVVYASVASAFTADTDGLLLDIDSLVADLSDQGLEDRDGAPITRATFDATINALAAEGDDGAAARLLVELGRAHATTTADPLWGEAVFDARQLLILGLALAAASDGSVAAGSLRQGGMFAAPIFTAAGGTPLGALGGRFRSGAQNAFRSAGAAACAALHSLNTHLRPFADPSDLWHRNGPGPSNATIEFILTRTIIPEITWALAGCSPPVHTRNLGTGEEPIPGVAVTWSPDAIAEDHGNLTNIRFTTDTNGMVDATYQTVNETTDQADWIPPNEQTERATFEVQAVNLVPGLPSTVAVKPSASKVVTIHWYEPANYKLTVHLEFVGTDDAFASNILVDGEWLLRPTGATDNLERTDYTGSGQLTFATTPQSGNCLFTYSGAGTFDAFAQALIPDLPDHPAPLEFHLGLLLDQVSKDRIVATRCPPGAGGIVSDGKISLLVLFVTATLANNTNPRQLTWDLRPWVAQSGGAFEVAVSGTCGLQGICRTTGFARLEQVVP